MQTAINVIIFSVILVSCAYYLYKVFKKVSHNDLYNEDLYAPIPNITKESEYLTTTRAKMVEEDKKSTNPKFRCNLINVR